MPHHVNRIGYSTSGFTDRDLAAALRSTREAGFDVTEIVACAAHLPEPLREDALRDLSQLIQDLGIASGTVHAPMERNVLGATDEEWREEIIDRISGFLEFAGAIGFSGLVVHPVVHPRYVDADEPGIGERIRSGVMRSLDALVPVAERTGVRLLLENLPYRDCTFPLLTIQELRPVVDAYPADAVGLVIDTGHAWTRKIDPASEIRTAGDRLCATHLQDVDYDDPADNHWPPTHGGLDWDSILAAFADIAYAGAFTFEIAHGLHGESPEELAAICRAVADEWTTQEDADRMA
jgi:sugar phosphate isomerase/epimerase